MTRIIDNINHSCFVQCYCVCRALPRWVVTKHFVHSVVHLLIKSNRIFSTVSTNGSDITNHIHVAFSCNPHFRAPKTFLLVSTLSDAHLIDQMKKPNKANSSKVCVLFWFDTHTRKDYTTGKALSNWSKVDWEQQFTTTAVQTHLLPHLCWRNDPSLFTVNIPSQTGQALLGFPDLAGGSTSSSVLERSSMVASGPFSARSRPSAAGRVTRRLLSSHPEQVQQRQCIFVRFTSQPGWNEGHFLQVPLPLQFFSSQGTPSVHSSVRQ